MITYKDIINEFQTFTLNHTQIHDYDFGDVSNIQSNEYDFPLVFLNPVAGRKDGNLTVLKFDMYITDVLEQDRSNTKDVMSKCLNIGNDIVGQFWIDRNEDLDFEINEQNITITPFEGRFDQLLGGWIFNIEITTLIPLSNCNIPLYDYVGTSGRTCGIIETTPYVNLINHAITGLTFSEGILTYYNLIAGSTELDMNGWWGSVSGVSYTEFATHTGDSSIHFSVSALTDGSVLFMKNGEIVEDNDNFFWDNTNKRLEIISFRSDYYRTSASTTLIGEDTGTYVIGTGTTAVGRDSMQYNNGYNNTAIGDNSFNDWTDGISQVVSSFPGLLNDFLISDQSSISQNTIIFQLPAGRSVDIYWGDGSSTTFEGNDLVDVSGVSSYSSTGTYQIQISGEFNYITKILITDSNISGDISGWANYYTGLNYLEVTGTQVSFDEANTMWNYSGATINLSSNTWSSDEVNYSLDSFVNCSSCTIRIDGTNSARTSSRNDEVALILANNNLLYVNDYYVPPQTGLVRHWTLYEDDFTTPSFLDEVSGITLDDYQSGVTFTTNHKGLPDKAVDFDGTYQLHSIDYTDLPLLATNRTVCFWVNCGDVIETTDGFFGYGTSSIRSTFAADYLSPGGGIRSQYWGDNSDPVHTLSGNNWYWVCITYGEPTNACYIYVNNVQLAPDNVGLNTASSLSQYLTVGGVNYSETQQLHGKMNNYMMYNRVLSASERLDIFTNQ